MTIVQKWRLMMSSFADIKAAIIEKGVALPDNKGYNRYANAVRQIYSDEYTDEYEYPSQYADPLNRTVPVSYALELVVWCKAIKEQIRLAIIDGGVDCDEEVPLAEYGDKIREIETEKALTIATTELPGATYGVQYNAQIEATGGTPPYTFSTYGIKPAGLTFGSDGSVTGTPTGTGYYTAIGITVTDSAGNSVSEDIKLRISPQYVTVKLTSESVYIYDGEPHTVTFECVENPEVPIIVKLGADYLSEATEVGTYYVTILSGDSHYLIKQDRDYYLEIREA